MADYYADNYKKVFRDFGNDLTYGVVDTNGQKIFEMSDTYGWDSTTGSAFDNTDKIELFGQNIPAGATVIGISTYVDATGTTETFNFQLQDAKTKAVQAGIIHTTAEANGSGAGSQDWAFIKADADSTVIAIPSGAIADNAYFIVSVLYTNP